MKKNKNIKALTISVAAFIVLCGLLLGILSLLMNKVKNQRTIDASYRYLIFNNSLENFLVSHTNMLFGFRAYVNTFDTLDDNEIYAFLEHLLEDNREYIRNVGILKDTTVLWNYPRENNSSVIGVDLSDVESQAPQILMVKNQNVKVFAGPVNLVQGGIGYIIRIPIRKGNEYWGQASIVLDGEKFIQYMDDISHDAGMNVLVLDLNKEETVLYGDPDILDKDPVTITKKTDFGLWNIYYIPSSTDARFLSVLLVTVLGFLLILGVTLFIYRHAVRNLQLSSQNIRLSETALKDKLTGVYNRAMFERYIYSELAKADSLGYDMSLIIFDLDHFKRVNDTYGHDTGDEVLVNTAMVTQKALRKSDLLIRWGGEEFLIILSNSNLNSAARIAEEIRKEISNFNHEKAGQVTISLGVAERLEFEFWESWFKRADKALYQAKKSGRNRLSISMDSKPIRNDSDGLNWKTEWFCGNEKIDQQHKELMIDANEMIAAYNNDISEFTVLFEKFYQSLKKHFRYEEGILRNVEYPFLEEHVQIHEQILVSVEKTKDNIQRLSTSSASIFDYILEEILVGHFLLEDFKFFNYLQKK